MQTRRTPIYEGTQTKEPRNTQGSLGRVVEGMKAFRTYESVYNFLCDSTEGRSRHTDFCRFWIDSLVGRGDAAGVR